MMSSGVWVGLSQLPLSLCVCVVMGAAGGMAGYSPSPPPYNIAEFIHQTNERLAILRQHLTTPHGYSSAVKALLEWCSNPR